METHILPKWVTPAAVVEHTVQHNPHSRLMKCFNQDAEVPFSAETRVKLGIGNGVISVVGVALENGIEINSLHAKFPEIGNFPGDPLQGTAKEISPRRNKIPTPPVFLPVTKTIRKDLIPEEALHPVRRGGVISGIHVGNIERPQHGFRQRRRDAQLREIHRAPIFQRQHKMIAQLVCPHGNRNRIIPFSRAAQSRLHLASCQHRLFLPAGKPEGIAVQNRSRLQCFPGAQAEMADPALHKLPWIGGMMLDFVT